MYGWRLRRHWPQELFAGLGIAAGVALFFAVLVTTTSITGSASRVLHGIIGVARLQVSARSPAGFDERLAERMGNLPGVAVAAPLLREDTVIVGPTGRRSSIQLVGVTASQVALRGEATRNLGAGAGLLAGGIGLPSGVASEIRAEPGGQVTLLTGTGAHQLRVRAVLGTQTIGPIADSPIAVALMPVAQRVTGLRGRVTQVFVQPQTDADREIEHGLSELAAGRLDVAPADHELSVLSATATPTRQSTTLFAVIGATVGFLIALNLMLLTMPERRRWVAEWRTQGYSARQILAILTSQAVLLGLTASVVGIALGDVLAHSLFGALPSYLTLAFPIGRVPVIPLGTIALTLACGVFATSLASVSPVLDLLPRRPIDAVMRVIVKAGQSVSTQTVLASSASGLLLITAAILLALLIPTLTVLSGVIFGAAVVCLVPVLALAFIGILMPISERVRGSMLAIGLAELRGTATRSLAVTAVAAMVIYGSVAIEGARHDLLSGLDAAVVQYLDTADIWVTAPGNSFLTVDPFHDPGAQTVIARIPGVASVRAYQGGLLDVGDRRLWIRARPANDRTLIQSSQLLHGNLASATALIRKGGWAAISDGFATSRHLAIESVFTLPTPSGAMPLRVAAITTNTGWPPGAITITASEYRRWWHTIDPTALEINLRPGISPQAGKHTIERALARPDLLVQTRHERTAQYKQSARQGVQTLNEISKLVLIVAGLAIAFALGATISARRRDLAARKTDGYNTVQLWRLLSLESIAILSVGAIDGTLIGILGHVFASRWLRLVQDFPAPFSIGIPQVLLTLAIIGTIALLVTAVFGALAARVPPALRNQD